MHVPPWLKPAGWGVVADTAAKLAAFQNTVSWQRSQVLEQGGWATAAGSTDPNAAVARVCAQQLAKRKT